MSGTTYTTTIYPFGEPYDNQANAWVLWDSDASNPITLSFASTPLAVAAIWIPQLTGPVTCYEGDTATGTPFYVSGGAGSEVIPVPTDTLDVTLVGSGGNMYVYYTTTPLSPFREGVIGNQVTAVTATAPVTSSGGTTPNIALTTPLAITYGGTGSASPVGVQAAPDSGITVTGSFPDQTIGTDFSGLGVVTAVTASAPLSSTGGTTPNISIGAPIPLALGGTNQTAPALNAGAGIDVTGTIFQPTGGSAWTVSNIGVTSIETDDSSIDTGDLHLHGTGGVVTSTAGASMHVDGSAFPLLSGLTSPDGSVGIDISGQNVALTASSGSFFKLQKLVGSNPSATLTLPALPSGIWLIESYVIGLDMTEGDTGDVASLVLSTGASAGCDGAQYTRYIGIADKVTSSGSTVVTATLTSSGTVGINSHFSYGSFLLKATSVSS